MAKRRTFEVKVEIDSNVVDASRLEDLIIKKLYSNDSSERIKIAAVDATEIE